MMKDTGSYALIPEGSNRVENIIVASDDYQRKGYYTIRYNDTIFCQPGMYYNTKTGLFYDEPEFRHINRSAVSGGE
ncbi:hypothetical protein SODG_000606 [Sodalis praecaptivus]